MTKLNISPARKPMNSVLYLRVSTSDQVKNFSLDTQNELCKAYAQRLDYQIIKIFREEGESAKTADRPELLKLLDYCRINKSKIGSVIVYKYDRVARNTSDHLAIRAKLAEYAIKLISATEPVDDSPAGKFMETLFAAVAELDNSVRAERARNGLYKRFKSGLATRPPLGFTTKEVNGKRIPVKDKYFDDLKRAWAIMVTGTKSLTEMAKVMNQMGITVNYGRKRKPITKQFAGKLFRNKFYAGYLISQKYNEEVLGIHEPMVTERTFYQVQSILSGRNQCPMGVKHKVVNVQFSLRGILKCNSCAVSLVSGNVKGRSKLYPKYWCINNCIRTVSVEDIGNMLKVKLNSIQPNQDLVNAFTLYLRVKYENRLGKLIDLKKTADKRILEQKQMMVVLCKGHAKGIYPDDAFKIMKADIEDKILTYQIVSNDNLCEKYDIERTVNFIKALFKNLYRAYENSDYGQKRILLGSIYPSGLTFNGDNLLNRSLGTGFEAISRFKDIKNDASVPFSARKFTRIEPILSTFRPLILAYPDYKNQFDYA